jgi:hypothetical protein
MYTAKSTKKEGKTEHTEEKQNVDHKDTILSLCKTLPTDTWDSLKPAWDSNYQGF